MAYRIAVSSKVEDARAQSLLRNLKTLFPQSALEGASYVQAYTIDAKLTPQELQSGGAPHAPRYRNIFDRQGSRARRLLVCA